MMYFCLHGGFAVGLRAEKARKILPDITGKPFSLVPGQ
jgi:hypothetical protein